MINLQILESQVSNTVLHRKIQHIYNELEDSLSKKKNWKFLDEQQIWSELCFCLLSGNVAYELAKSVVSVLSEKGLLDYEWIINKKNAQEKICLKFMGSNFEPKKNDGSLRKYRYPTKRSIEIVKAAKIIYSTTTIKQILSSDKSEVEIRNYFAENIPGLGIKEASHFLRNIGFANSLAIIDVHVLSFLKENDFVNYDKNSSLTTRRYVILEKILKNFAKFHNLSLSILDLAIWHYMRNRII